MRYARTVSAACSLLLLTLLVNFAAREAHASDTDDYDVRARVARISFLRGDVTLRRAGSDKWERAARNLPLVEGDVLATRGDARVEIQIDRRNFVRVSEYSALRIITLRNEGVALSLSEGTATVRLARFDREREYFEVDAPNTTLAAERVGLYRIDAQPSGVVRLTARDGGRARIYSETSGFTLRDGRMAELTPSSEDIGDWQLAAALPSDSWDEWTRDREQYLISRSRYEDRDRYYDTDLWGAEELDAYGDWAYTERYGYVWRPRVTVINNYNNWAPYRYGQWRWCPPYGWTWVGDEPWGWAPYHYGRWVYHENNWCWTPRITLALSRAIWRPALVVFVNINNNNYGNHIAWYPLGYNQRDPRGRNYRRLTALRRDELANLERTNPANLRAVTTLPARDFGTQAATRTRPATEDLARRVVTSEPARPDVLPARPRDVNAANNTTNERGNNRPADSLSPRARPARPAEGTGAPARELPERATGAATRSPGQPLDDQLRRTRLYNNRQPRPSSPNVDATPNNGGVDRNVENINNTGAIERPARPPRVGRPPRDDDRGNPPSRGGVTTDDGNSRSDNNNGTVVSEPEERRERPVRPAQPRHRFPREDAPSSGGDQPDRNERRRTAPEPRAEEPSPRPEAPTRQEPPPHIERPREEAPPPREREQPAPPRAAEPEPQRRSEPAPPREERPPQREQREDRPARPARVERPDVRDQR